MAYRMSWLVYVALVLAAVVAWLGFRVTEVELRQANVDPANISASQDLKELGRQQTAPDIDSVDFLERPLFWLTRRPPEVIDEKPTVEAPEAAAELPPGLQISGVVRDGDSWFILGTLGPKALRLKTGEEVKGWTITEISPDNVIFASGKKTATIKLFEPKPAVAAAKNARPRANARKPREPSRSRQADQSKERDE